jgi:DNA replication protein DnaC
MMNNEILAGLLAEYRLQREQNEREEHRRQDAASRRSPELASMILARQEALYEGIQSMFTGSMPADIEKRMGGYTRRIDELLRENGLPPDQLDPVYRCHECRDTAYAGEDAGTLCVCARKRYTEILAQSRQFENSQTFESYDESVYPSKPLPGTDITQRAYMSALRDRCEEYANALPRPHAPNLLFYGSSGLGKTFLLRAIYMRALDRGVSSQCVTANALLKTIREAYFGHEQKALDMLYEVPLLLIDDLGTEPMLENITVEQIFCLLNERQNARLATVISTNLGLNELKARYTERVLSRLMDARACQQLRFIGEDVRLRRMQA